MCKSVDFLIMNCILESRRYSKKLSKAVRNIIRQWTNHYLDRMPDKKNNAEMIVNDLYLWLWFQKKISMVGWIFPFLVYTPPLSPHSLIKCLPVIPYPSSTIHTFYYYAFSQFPSCPRFPSFPTFRLTLLNYRVLKRKLGNLGNLGKLGIREYVLFKNSQIISKISYKKESSLARSHTR